MGVVPVGLALNVPFAGLWVILFLLIAVHEGGHALAAIRLRFPIEEVGLGVGPRLLTLTVGSVDLVVRAVPILGWVMTEDPPAGRRRFLHRRQAWLSLAGPAASIAAAALCLTAYLLAVTGTQALNLATLRWVATETASTTVEAPKAVLHRLIDLVDIDDRANPRTVGGSTRSIPEDTNSRDEGEVVTVVGMSSYVTEDVDSGGAVALLVWAFVLSASIGGFNLLPAYGLDCHGVLVALLGGVRARHDAMGRTLQRCLTVLALAMAVGVLALVAVGLVRDTWRLL